MMTQTVLQGRALDALAVFTLFHSEGQIGGEFANLGQIKTCHRLPPFSDGFMVFQG